MSALAYLSRLCVRWGGELIPLPSPSFHAMTRCPGVSTHPLGAHAIDHARHQIFVSRRLVNPGTVIHEMGHVFLDEGKTSTTYEPDWLGWEIMLARRARCYREWSSQNAGYIIYTGRKEHEWQELSPRQRRRCISNRINYAREIGILSRDGAPLCTRKVQN